MSYAKSVLQPGERIVVAGKLHWIAYWHAILFLVVGIIVVLWEARVWPNQTVLAAITAIVFGALFLVSFLHAWFRRWITEIAVTDRRIIYKRGFIQRYTQEMNMDKVSTVDVEQSILGRILDYGTIEIIGTGGATEGGRPPGIEPLKAIAAPLALRNAIVAK
jgi:uncharacterized membrane protein YdbT with pleckstrin-like domain